MSQISVRTMTVADIDFGMELKAASGWNQLQADWHRVLELTPGGCFLGALDGTPVGTVASTRFGDVAWISLMLVSEAARGQGVGKALMLAALHFLDAAGVKTVRLDATPLGRPLYEKLGFSIDLEAARFAGRPTIATGDPSKEVVTLTEDMLEKAATLDRDTTATDRQQLLQRLFQDERGHGWAVTDGTALLGFQMKRSGARATQIGPCNARGNAGFLLLDAALRRHSNENVYVDIPLANEAACELVKKTGLEVQRPLYRMTRGPRIDEKPHQIWASFGPEKG